MSQILRTVEFLLWQQHAICESHRPQFTYVRAELRGRGECASFEASPRLVTETPRARGLLLNEIRKLLDQIDATVPKTPDIWIHPPRSEVSYRGGYKEPEQTGSVDPVVGPKRAHGSNRDFFRSGDPRDDVIGEFEDGRPIYRGDYMSRADRKD
jgi:hypothetical protein